MKDTVYPISGAFVVWEVRKHGLFTFRGPLISQHVEQSDAKAAMERLGKGHYLDVGDINTKAERVIFDYAGGIPK